MVPSFGSRCRHCLTPRHSAPVAHARASLLRMRVRSIFVWSGLVVDRQHLQQLVCDQVELLVEAGRAGLFAPRQSIARDLQRAVGRPAVAVSGVAALPGSEEALDVQNNPIIGEPAQDQFYTTMF